MTREEPFVSIYLWRDLRESSQFQDAGRDRLRLQVVAVFFEKWYPRHFDVSGAGHQIMHMVVPFAGVAYVFRTLVAFNFLLGDVGNFRGANSFAVARKLSV
ncbi:hypothetical protein F5Y15DRAFT_369012 [Xylariaceae sp. FL0016]|nr:hypothetical protein F5Y15DRAFT_369012 [Xylariaceae sp. FL0016]